jgi:hypothetical protein
MVSSLAAAAAKLKVTKDIVEEGNLITKNKSYGSKRNDTSSTVAHPPNSRCNPKANVSSSNVKNSDTNTTPLKDYHNNQGRHEPKKLSSLASQLKQNTSSKGESQLQEGKSKNKNIQKQKKHHVVASFIYDLSSESESENNASNEQKQTHHRTRFNRALAKPRKNADSITHDTKIPTQKTLPTTKEKPSYSSSVDMQQKIDPTLKILEKQDTKPHAKHTVQLLSSSQLNVTGIKIKQHSSICWADDSSTSDSDGC